MQFPNSIRIHSFIPSTRANGPGLRAGIWFQGCDLGCPGCFNPETHPSDKISFSTIPSLVDLVAESAQHFNIEGVTISGGEPFQQLPQLLKLIRMLRDRLPGLSIIIFTGYTSKETLDMLAAHGTGLGTLIDCCDVLIPGRYNQNARVAEHLKASANKTFHFFSERYSEKDFQTVPQAEVIIAPNGQITLSGINPLRMA